MSDLGEDHRLFEPAEPYEERGNGGNALTNAQNLLARLRGDAPRHEEPEEDERHSPRRRRHYEDEEYGDYEDEDDDESYESRSTYSDYEDQPIWKNTYFILGVVVIIIFLAYIIFDHMNTAKVMEEQNQRYSLRGLTSSMSTINTLEKGHITGAASLPDEVGFM